VEIKEVKRGKYRTDIFFQSEGRTSVRLRAFYREDEGLMEHEEIGEVGKGIFYFQIPSGDVERIELFVRRDGEWSLVDERGEAELPEPPKVETTVITPEKITLESLTADPAVQVAGDIWFRSDLGAIKLAVDPAIGDIRKLFSDRDHLVPAADNTYDLGSSTLRWRGLYLADRYFHDAGITVRIIESYASGYDTLTYEHKPGENLALRIWNATDSYSILDLTRDEGNLTIPGFGNLGSLRIGGTEVINPARRLVGIDRVDQMLDFYAPCEHYRAQPADSPLPLALYVYYNRNYLAFAEPDTIEYFDGTTWAAWPSPPDFRRLTDGIATEVIIDDVHKQFRLTYKAGVKGVSGDLHVSGCTAVIVSFGWDADVTATITVESSGDGGVTWTTRGSYSVSATRDRWVYFPIEEIYPDTWIRFTFDIALAAGESVPLHHLLLLTGRPNYQGLAALDSGFPFTWETDKTLILKGHMRPSTDNAYDLGTSTYFWRDIYQKGKHYFDPDSYAYYDTATSRLKIVVDGAMVLEMGA